MRESASSPDPVVFDDLTVRPTRRAVFKRRQRHAGSSLSGARTSVLSTLRQLPSYLRLLTGLATDGRVSRLDKLVVLGAIAYVLAPIDMIPDFIPFLGQVDDVFVLMTSLQRLIGRAGRDVLTDHWTGDPDELSDLNLSRVVAAAAVFMPPSIRSRLKRIGR